MPDLLRDVLGVLGVGFVSALVPVVNIEALLTVRAAAADVGSLWLLAFAAAFGQMLGKLVWYYLGATSLRWGWVRRKLDRPKAQERLLRWRTRIRERPVLSGGLVLVAAATGVPPFAIIAVLMGQLRMNLAAFYLLGLAGRWLRFAAVLGGAQWLGQLFEQTR